jgi:hypothetical protein
MGNNVKGITEIKIYRISNDNKSRLHKTVGCILHTFAIFTSCIYKWMRENRVKPPPDSVKYMS